jgi:small subunit ribosomal protein S16
MILMLTIRLSRIGKTKKPKYRLIISEKAKDPYGRALEILGSYDPFTKNLAVQGDRIKYWLSKGSGMSATVNNLLVGKGIIEGKKVKASSPGKKKKGEEEPQKEGAAKTEEPKPENKGENESAKGIKSVST